MTLRVLKFNSATARYLAAACCAAGVVVALLFAKWNLANAISTHTAEKDGADLAVTLAPSDPQTHFAAAVIYEKTFEPQDATRSLEEYRLAAAASPFNYLAWLELARAEERSGDDRAAEIAFQRALELAPNYSSVQWSYGNFLVRTGRQEDGFRMIARAAAADTSKMPNAVSMALAYYDGDIGRTRELLGNTGDVNIALANGSIAAKDPARALEAWNAIDPAERRGQFKTEGQALAARLAEQKQYRLAVRVLGDIADGSQAVPFPETITNGGFEKVDPANTSIFDWHMPAGAGQQIGVSAERHVEGDYSLFMAFNTMKTAEFRQLFQTVAVEPGAAYTLTGSYRSELKGGVAWEAVDPADGKVLARAPLAQESADWAVFQLNFTEPASSDGVLIRLVRDNCIGEVCPISGKLWLDAVALTRQKQQ